MKIKHAVVLNSEEINALFDIVEVVCKDSFPTVEAEQEAIAKAKIEFETMLNMYTQKAFKFGKRIGKARADEKDSKMYSQEEST